MPVKHCCYGDCNSDSRYVGIRPDMDGIKFIPFPKPKTQLEKCERWLRLCGRKYFTVDNVRKETYICSKHFVGNEGPTDCHPDPLPALSTEFERRLLSSKKKRKPPNTRSSPKKRRKILITEEEDGGTSSGDIAECVNEDHNYTAWGVQDKHCSAENNQSPSRAINEQYSTGNSELDVPCLEGEVIELTTTITSDTQTQTEQNNVCVDIGVQTTICMEHLTNFSTQELQDKTRIGRKLFLTSVLKDDESCKFYTGVTLVMFTFLFSWTKQKAEKLNYWRGQDTTESTANQKTGPKRKLRIQEEFLMTLLRLKRGFDVEVLGDLFGVHPSSISRIFTTWINFLYLELNFLISWPTKEQVTSNLPKAFKYFPKTRAIIDCTEFFVQRPSLPSSQRVTWSQYKHHNTLKALISISPTGSFTFISKLFTGSISDRRIVQESGFLDMLQYGDDVMADRGFFIRDLLARRSTTLNIPPFSMGKQLSSRAVTKTRRIASARIHVERAIGRLKTFKILQGIMPLKLHPLFDQIIGVCASLCNLDSKLVK